MESAREWQMSNGRRHRRVRIQGRPLVVAHLPRSCGAKGKDYIQYEDDQEHLQLIRRDPYV